LSKQQADDLLLWLRESEERKKFFDIITDIWHTSATLSRSDAYEPGKAWDEIIGILETHQIEETPKTGKIRSFIQGYYKVAVVVTIILATGFGAMYVYFAKKMDAGSGQFVEMMAPRGSRSFATLPDGTKVWLNSGSKIRFSKKYGTGTRDVNLDGEAYFVVAKNKAVPFVVHTSDIKITALGTAFNVKAYRDEAIIGTTLDEGSVKIEPCLNTTNTSPLILKPKQSAAYSKSSTSVTLHEMVEEHGGRELVTKHVLVPPKQLKVIRPMDTRIFTSWKEAKWIFRHEQMDDLVRKLERKYDVTFVFEDEALKEYSFTGSLKDESIEQVLEVIRLVAPISYKINHKTIELSLDKKLEIKYGKALNKGTEN
jgi:ferric-dicitrate binding protein FerR (iron transport regulator)